MDDATRAAAVEDVANWLNGSDLKCPGAVVRAFIAQGKELTALKAERDRLRTAVTNHHAQKADDRCWLDDIDLYVAAGLVQPDIHVGDKTEMLKNCERFLKTRCIGGKWPSYAELEQQLAALKAACEPFALIATDNPDLPDERAIRPVDWVDHMRPIPIEPRMDTARRLAALIAPTPKA